MCVKIDSLVHFLALLHQKMKKVKKALKKKSFKKRKEKKNIHTIPNSQAGFFV